MYLWDRKREQSFSMLDKSELWSNLESEICIVVVKPKINVRHLGRMICLGLLSVSGLGKL